MLKRVFSRRHLRAEEIRRPVEYLTIQDHFGKETRGYIPRQVVEEEMGISVSNQKGELTATWFNVDAARAIRAHPLFVTPDKWNAALAGRKT